MRFDAITSTHVLAAAGFTLVVGVVAVLVLGGSRRRRQAVADTVNPLGTSPLSAQLLRLESWLLGLAPFQHFQRRLAGAGHSKWRSPRVTFFLLLGMLVVKLVMARLVGDLVSTVIMFAVPLIFGMWLKQQIVKRSERFIAQLPEVSRIVASGTAAGLSMRRCLAIVSREMAAPAKEEFELVVQQLSLGWELNRAFDELAHRLPSRELNVLVRTIVIQSSAGGALVGALQDIALSLEDRKELRREVKTMIMTSSVSGYAVMLLGMASLVVLNSMQPGVVDDMARSPVGQIILLVSGVLFALGAGAIKVLSRVDV